MGAVRRPRGAHRGPPGVPPDGPAAVVAGGLAGGGAAARRGGGRPGRDRLGAARLARLEPAGGRRARGLRVRRVRCAGPVAPPDRPGRHAPWCCRARGGGSTPFSATRGGGVPSSPLPRGAPSSSSAARGCLAGPSPRPAARAAWPASSSPMVRRTSARRRPCGGPWPATPPGRSSTPRGARRRASPSASPRIRRGCTCMVPRCWPGQPPGSRWSASPAPTSSGATEPASTGRRARPPLARRSDGPGSRASGVCSPTTLGRWWCASVHPSVPQIRLAAWSRTSWSPRCTFLRSRRPSWICCSTRSAGCSTLRTEGPAPVWDGSFDAGRWSSGCSTQRNPSPVAEASRALDSERLRTLPSLEAALQAWQAEAAAIPAALTG